MGVADKSEAKKQKFTQIKLVYQRVADKSEAKKQKLTQIKPVYQWG